MRIPTITAVACFYSAICLAVTVSASGPRAVTPQPSENTVSHPLSIPYEGTLRTRSGRELPVSLCFDLASGTPLGTITIPGGMFSIVGGESKDGHMVIQFQEHGNPGLIIADSKNGAIEGSWNFGLDQSTISLKKASSSRQPDWM